jgi:cell division protein YceG involved in septum cleavage
MSPANTKYLYFVAKGDGRSVFSETYDAHAAAVRAAGHR